jgi:hypothetical protein
MTHGGGPGALRITTAVRVGSARRENAVLEINHYDMRAGVCAREAGFGQMARFQKIGLPVCFRQWHQGEVFGAAANQSVVWGATDALRHRSHSRSPTGWKCSRS